ncbi:hypothetical protein AACH06_01430 [Ideonella sp. DXS29W]|uniref:DUF3995 domain-containing protein n=1 Tax=Ideonella lacteola TaxID=2984193 RepID=A0ABU9BHN7_9BURK
MPHITPLALGGCLSALAALAHLACVAIGGPAYRWMGAGEGLARAAEAGRWQPTAITLCIAAVLAVWALYAWAGAGWWTPRSPWPGMKLALPLISAIYLVRGVAFPWLKPHFPDNSNLFWLVSSAICLLIGGLHAWGTVSRWSEL